MVNNPRQLLRNLIMYGGGAYPAVRFPSTNAGMNTRTKRKRITLRDMLERPFSDIVRHNARTEQRYTCCRPGWRSSPLVARQYPPPDSSRPDSRERAAVVLGALADARQRLSRKLQRGPACRLGRAARRLPHLTLDESANGVTPCASGQPRRLGRRARHTAR